MTELLPSYTDSDGTTWYPVLHAFGGIVCSLSEDSQRLWQECADRQMAGLLQRMEARKARASVPT